MTKILVGCPTYDKKGYSLSQYAKAVKALTHPDIEVLVIDTTKGTAYHKELEAAGLPVAKGQWYEDPKKRVAEARNLLRSYAIVHGHTHFLSLEPDVIPEPDTVERLLAHKKDYVSTIVMTGKVVAGKKVAIPLVLVDWEGRPGKLRPLKVADTRAGPLIPIQGAALACTLLSRDILKRFPFRSTLTKGDDVCLCDDLRKAGIDRWCDTTLRPAHRPGKA